MMITSNTNEQIKNLIQLKEKGKTRKKSGTFIVEGIKMFTEIPARDFVKAYVSESFYDRNQERITRYFTDNNIKEEPQLVSDSVFKKISDTVTPQGILAVVKQKNYSLEQIMNGRNKEKSCIVVLDRIQDPGNLGTIVRTGEAAGITGIIMSSTTVDIYNPKVIRSTMGSIYRVPFVIVEDLQETIGKMKKEGITCFAAHLKGEVYHAGTLTGDCGLLIGNEAQGLSKEVSDMADKWIKIPMKGKVESLNAAIATSILMYEAMR